MRSLLFPIVCNPIDKKSTLFLIIVRYYAISMIKRQRWCWLWCGAEQATCHSIQTNEGAFIKSLDHDNLSTDPDDTQVRWLWSMHSTVKIFPKSAAVGRCAWQSSLWNRLSMQMIWCRVGCKNTDIRNKKNSLYWGVRGDIIMGYCFQTGRHHDVHQWYHSPVYWPCTDFVTSG